VESCIVVDIGGTSTDIAFLDDGFPRLNPEGAVVGQWRTRARAIDMWTAGLGGDSGIMTDRDGVLKIGPERVIPLAVASRLSPEFLPKVKAQSEVAFYFPARSSGEALTGEAKKVFDYVLNNAPCSLNDIMNNVDEVYLFNDDIAYLKSKGYVLQSGFTPTDALHVSKAYEAGDRDASLVGGQILADKEDLSVEAFSQKVLTRVITRVGEEILNKIILDETGGIPTAVPFERYLRASVGEEEFKAMKVRITMDRPLIGVGAPAHFFVEPLQERFDAQVIVPPDHDVGNAVGAVCSQISETMVIRIYPKDGKFIVFAPSSAPMEYGHKGSAMESARRTAEDQVRTRVELAGAEDVRVRTVINEERFCDGYGKEMQFINWIDVKVTATGRPKLRTGSS
jgi:N-methylhydantoinase A/oxoprolinase/acetone carboxylase beta subunit